MLAGGRCALQYRSLSKDTRSSRMVTWKTMIGNRHPSLLLLAFGRV
jgi:hypothetical protein